MYVKIFKGLIMSKQFKDVITKYGAPMGRPEMGYLDTETPKSIQLFKVRLDSGGYDDGGAYWGLNYGSEYLFCARDSEGGQQFIRASSREKAAFLLGIPNKALKIRLHKNGLDYGLALVDGKAPMPIGKDRQDAIDWMRDGGSYAG